MGHRDELSTFDLLIDDFLLRIRDVLLISVDGKPGLGPLLGEPDPERLQPGERDPLRPDQQRAEAWPRQRDRRISRAMACTRSVSVALGAGSFRIWLLSG